MSKRPIPIDDLLKEDAIVPKYIPKSKRAKSSNGPGEDGANTTFKLQYPQISVNYGSAISRSTQFPAQQKSSTRPTTSLQPPSKLRHKKFQFDWDDIDDPHYNPQPLYSFELDQLGVGNGDNYDDNNNDDYDDDDDFDFQDPLLHDDRNSGHWSTKLLSEMTDRDWRIFNEDYGITTKGKKIPHATRSWDESGLNPKILASLKSFGFHQPTPVQRASIPISLELRDVVGVAETGSGKTLAFLLPLLHYLSRVDENYLNYEKVRNEPLALVLAPTRELALQITQEAEKFGKQLGFNVLSIIGGRQYQETMDQIDNMIVGRGVHIVVGTPGRLLDSVERKILNFSKCYYLVMDEADRMIDMGFEKDLNKLINLLPKNEKLSTTIDGKLFHLTKRLTMMYTATISPPIEKITKSYLIDPAYIYIGGAGEALDNIDQHFDYLSTYAESARLSKLIKVVQGHKRRNRNALVIIFANFKHVCDVLSLELEQNNLLNVVIHGSKSQEAREEALDDFRTHQAPILVATDVAARGIDVPNVSLVINYQMSKKFDEYIHRIGRTGRAGNLGESYTFLDDADAETFMPLKKFLKSGRKKVPEWLYRYNLG